MSARPWTAFPDLDEVLEDLRRSVRAIVGDAFVGMYLQGSFALGAGDARSDADFIVVVAEPLPGAVEARLRHLHDEIPTRPGIWNTNIEGSYADARSLRSPSGLGVPWLFNDHGSRTLEKDLHCNNLHVRWILRNCGITLDGPPIGRLVDEVPQAALKQEARADLIGALAGIETWADMSNAWTQKYIVHTYSRLLYTATTGRVASKPQSLIWATRWLDPKWNALLRQVAEDRALAWHPDDPPRPGSMDLARRYAKHVEELVPGLNEAGQHDSSVARELG